MSWIKIKKAINSTLGTTNFKPLDQIINKGFDDVSAIQAQIKEKSDNTLDALESGENNFTANFAKSVTSLFAKKIEDKDTSSFGYKFDLYESGEGLYMIIEKADSGQENYTHFLYYNGGKSKSVTWYSTSHYSSACGNHYVSVNNGVMEGEINKTHMYVYKINISMDVQP